MADKKGDGENKKSEFFDFEKELSALASKNVIPEKIANKLKVKLKERDVELTKEQLYMLVNKVKNIIDNYKPGDQKTTPFTGANTDMQKLVETIGRLEERITSIETGKPSEFSTYTTEDMQVGGKWELGTLTQIPNDPESIIILMKWLQYLVDKCGHLHLAEILDYYVDIGWISDDAKISLLDYSKGITEEKKQGEHNGKEMTDLPSRDHIQSLLFIQKLKGYKFDRHFIDRIDGEIFRLTKKLDNYRLK